MKSLKPRSALAQDFVTNSTFHGLHDVYRSETRSLKLLWAVIFLAGLGAASYGCFAIISAYLESPVVVSYVVQESASLPLPDIVVCPPNRLNKTFLLEHNISERMATHIEMAFVTSPILPFQQHHKALWENASSLDANLLHEQQRQLDAKLLQMNFTGKNAFKNFLKAAEINCRAWFDHTMNAATYPKECEKLPSYMTASGRCYRLRSPPQNIDGFGGGAKAFLKLPLHLYTAHFNNLPIDGIFIKLAQMTDSDTPIKPGTANSGVDQDFTLIPRGVFTVITLRSTRYEFRNDPPRFECKTKADSGFSRVTCVDNCLYENAIKNCSCIPASSVISSDFPLCSPYKVINCIQPYIDSTFNTNTSKAAEARRTIKMCKDKCKPLCSYWKFTPQISTVPLISKPYERLVNDSDQKLEDLQNRIVIEMYHEYLEYTLIKHFPSMSADSFVAQIGGQISLWVGGSILTVVQLIIFLIQLAFPGKMSNKMSKSCQNRLDNFKPKPSSDELVKNSIEEPISPVTAIDNNYPYSLQKDVNANAVHQRSRANDSMSTQSSGQVGESSIRSSADVVI